MKKHVLFIFALIASMRLSAQTVTYVSKTTGDTIIITRLEEEGYVLSKDTSLVSLISKDTTLTIKAVNGTRTFQNSSSVISYGALWKDEVPSNVKSAPTSITEVQVYQMVKPANEVELFSAVDTNFATLCLTQHQIVEFCATNSNWILQKGQLLFLYKEGNVFYEIHVMWIDGKPSAIPIHLGHFGHLPMNPASNIRIAVPKRT